PGFYVDRDVVRGVDVRVKRGAVVTGTVTSRRNGEPVQGAEVVVHGPDFQHQDGGGLFGGWLGDPNNVPAQTVTTDKQGRFRIANAYTGGAGEVQLMLKLEINHSEHLVEVVPVNVAEGGEIDLGLVELTPGGRIRGVAYGKDGKALAGGTVILTRPGGAGSFFSETRTLDARGRFSLGGLKAGTYEVSVYNAEEASSLLLFTEAPSETVYVEEGGEAEVDIRLSDG
ncbi:MAG TPA: carboxypeptidase-like regulatory domain-containing protein, partial [Planctomycetota bacterium]